LIQKNFGTKDRALAGAYPDALRQHSLFTSFATLRAPVWSVPIQNRINRNQGNLSHQFHYSIYAQDALYDSAHKSK
jgi:hypothetical protein